MKYLNFFKKSLSKKKQQRKEKTEIINLIDKDLPLGVHIGSKISISKSQFVLNKNDMLMDDFPKDMYVIKIGKHEKGYRYYLGENTTTQLMLDILIEKDYTEYRIFTVYEQLKPRNNDEDFWDMWLNDENGIIGSSSFIIELDTDTDIDYDRTVGDEDVMIAPMELNETIYYDRHGKIVVEDEQLYMTYGRWIVEDVLAEYVIVSANESANAASIKIMIGTDINESNINVTY